MKYNKLLKLCLRCEADQVLARRNSKRRELDKDWAWSYQSKLAKQLRSLGISKCAIDLEPPILRAIMAMQQTKCGLTGYTLHVPTVVEVRQGWEKWRMTLDSADRLYTPVLVRAVATAGWVSGNVFFIAALLHSAYEACGGLKEFLKLTHKCNSNPVIVPTATSINEVRAQQLRGKYT